MIDDDKNETITSLLHTIALIREAAGDNEKPMLSELPDVIRKLRKERDDLRREILESLHPDVRESHAAAREWDFPDCLKENTNE